MRLEDRKTLEDSKAKLDEVHQAQANVQETIERVRQTQIKEQKAIEKSESKLEDVHQAQTKTQETVEKVRQTQVEDSGTLQHIKSTLDEVRQTQTNMQGTVKKESHTQLEDRGTLQVLDELRQTQTKTQETVEAVEADLKQMKQVFGSLKEERKMESQADEVLRNLARSEFKGDIEYHVGRFQEGTREWVFKKAQNWLDDRNSQNRVMVISANAGMGKSVISAVICKRMQEAGRLSGSHFCQHNNARYRNTQLMLQSLACHLCQALPKYKQALVNQLSRNLGKDLSNMGAEELFALLFKEPLSTVADPGRNMLTVIDGLDESEYQERNELLDIIANHFCKLPCWIRFLCTTRPERNISEALKQLKPFRLEPNEEENVKDIKLFLVKNTQCLRPENKGAIVDKLVEKSEGLMLYAHFVVSFIEENVSVLDQGDLNGSLPLAISSVYRSYFKRLEDELMKELDVKEENFLDLLCAVTASREPLPIAFVSKVLVPNTNPPLARRKVLKAIGSVSSLLPMRDDGVHVFHKSVQDWLTDTSCYGVHEFTVYEKQGHRILANLCSDELDNLKQKGVHDAQFSPTEKYALQHGVRHMLQLVDSMATGECSLEQCVQTYVIDLELVYAKLYVSTSVAEDILWLQRQKCFQLLPDESKRSLNTLLSLFRKYHYTLTSHPKIFFQTVLAEGGTVLSSQASNILKTKYPEIPYMGYVHKAVEQGTVLARFPCSSQVVCFDVSPKLDCMVCECRDGKIHSWRLSTGVLLWSRPVQITKHFQEKYFAYRKLPSSPALSFYRSVVFHPTKDVVLPGVLRDAYTFDGDLQPLFPESNCRFTVCSISGDKTKMLTDCLDDAKCIIMWSLENGSEVTRITRNEDVLSFAWSQDGKLLAISHSTGSVCFVDLMDSCRLLAQMATPNACGIIKLSPDSRFLFCGYTNLFVGRLYRFNIDMAKDPRVRLDDSDDFTYVPWKFESSSECGFLLGDPLSCPFIHCLDPAFGFVLNEKDLLRGYPQRSVVDMLNINKLRETDGKLILTGNCVFSFSLRGETIYEYYRGAVRAWDVSSGACIAKKSYDPVLSHTGLKNQFLAVKEGVLLTTKWGTPELWNFELSKFVRSWTRLERIELMIPITGDLERVACAAHNKVIILDTTSGKILLTVPTGGRGLVACNSNCRLLTYRTGHLYLSDGHTTFWEKFLRLHLKSFEIPIGMFSLSDRFALIGACLNGMYVFDAVSGEPLHILCKGSLLFDCKFVSDEECVISSQKASRVYCLQLFNVQSADLLSVINLETAAYCLAACPCTRHLAIEERDSKQGFKLIPVHLPQNKDSRKIKR